MRSVLDAFGRRLFGGFPEFIRVNLRIEAAASIAFGIFYAGLSPTPAGSWC